MSAVTQGLPVGVDLLVAALTLVGTLRFVVRRHARLRQNGYVNLSLRAERGDVAGLSGRWTPPHSWFVRDGQIERKGVQVAIAALAEGSRRVTLKESLRMDASWAVVLAETTHGSVEVAIDPHDLDWLRGRLLR
ncbi:MAG: hypothetical protein FWF90_13455 [Promicromonosporaceae bacterium]|nr:hypothetical protein [Promicromonosporaceae bacterium]